MKIFFAFLLFNFIKLTLQVRWGIYIILLRHYNNFYLLLAVLVAGSKGYDNYRH